MNQEQLDAMNALDGALWMAYEKIDELYAACEDVVDFPNSPLGAAIGYVQDQISELQDRIHTHIASGEL